MVVGACLLVASVIVAFFGTVFGLFRVLDMAHVLLTYGAYVGWFSAMCLMLGLVMMMEKKVK
jgi:hypothetical protein